MCIKRENKVHKKYLYPNWGEGELVSYLYVDGGGDILYVGPEDTVTVVCPDGKIHTEITPGYIKLYQKPVHVVWAKKALHSIKVGVPRESTSKGIGFHANIALQLTDPETILVAKEKAKLTYSDIKRTLVEISRTAFESIEEDALNDIQRLRKEFNRKLNALLMNTDLKAFTAVTTSFGTSNMCGVKEVAEE